jgi:hypothetical protein|tara:strand:+ start:44 stop:238 length:195 start_codon:yes stop_codon:yes gene_type:complete
MNKELFSIKEQLADELHTLHEKLDKLQLTVDELNAKLTKHIGFIDETYDGLKNPINAARRLLGR